MYIECTVKVFVNLKSIKLKAPTDLICLLHSPYNSRLYSILLNSIVTQWRHQARILNTSLVAPHWKKMLMSNIVKENTVVWDVKQTRFHTKNHSTIHFYHVTAGSNPNAIRTNINFFNFVCWDPMPLLHLLARIGGSKIEKIPKCFWRGLKVGFSQRQTTFVFLVYPLKCQEHAQLGHILRDKFYMVNQLNCRVNKKE